jgi:uncharacterized protein
MPKKESYIQEDLIRDAEKILADIGSFGEEGGFPSGTEELVQNEIRKEEMEAVDASARPVMDGHVEITVNEDKLAAQADFYPPSEGSKPIELQRVEKMIESLKIVHGIDWEAIREAIFKCNTELAPLGDILIARGTKPKNEVPAYLVVEAALIEKSAAGDSDELRLDYREQSPFKLVKKGDVLARVEPKKPGEMGSDIMGLALPYGKDSVDYPKPARNTQWGGGLATAACDGRFMIDGKTFWVNEVLDLPGSVDYSTGNVQFPGDVVIAGEVKQGFKVRSGGSIFCSKVIDATEVVAAGDIVTSQGILGRKTGVVKAGGGIRTKFIENCFIEAIGPIKFTTGCLNSVIQTLDRLDSGPKGVISGGKVYARNGINVAQIGTAAGPKTEIICGIDYTVQQKLLWIRDKNIALVMKLREIERRSAAGGTPQLVAIRAKIKAFIHQLNEAAKVLVNNLDKNDKAEVVVRGSMYPGAYIEICHVSFVVTSVMTRQRLYLDKTRGRVISEKLVR